MIAYGNSAAAKGNFNVGITLGIDFDDGYFFNAVVIETTLDAHKIPEILKSREWTQ